MNFLDKVKDFFGFGNDKEETNQQLGNEQGDISLTSQEQQSVLDSFPVQQQVQQPIEPIQQQQAQIAPTNVESIFDSIPTTESEPFVSNVDLGFEQFDQSPSSAVTSNTINEPSGDTVVSEGDGTFLSNTLDVIKKQGGGAFKSVSDWITGRRLQPYLDAVDDDGFTLYSSNSFGDNRRARKHRSIVEDTVVDGGGYGDYLSGLESQRERYAGENNIFGGDKFLNRYGEGKLSEEEYEDIVRDFGEEIINREADRSDITKKEQQAFDKYGLTSKKDEVVAGLEDSVLFEGIPSYLFSERMEDISSVAREISNLEQYGLSAALNVDRIEQGGSDSSFSKAKGKLDVMSNIISGVSEKYGQVALIGFEKGQSGIRDFLKSELTGIVDNDTLENLNLGELENLYYKKDFIGVDWSEYGLSDRTIKHRDISPENLLTIMKGDINRIEAAENLANSKDLFEAFGNVIGQASSLAGRGFVEFENVLENRNVGRAFSLSGALLGPLGLAGSLYLGNRKSNDERSGISGDVEGTRFIRSKEEIKEDPLTQWQKRKRSVAKFGAWAMNNSPEAILLLGEILAPVPGAGKFKAVGKATKVFNRMTDAGSDYKTAMSVASRVSAGEFAKDSAKLAGLLGKEATIEQTIQTFQSTEGRASDDFWNAIGFGIGGLVEALPFIKNAAKYYSDKDAFQTLISANASAIKAGADGLDKVHIQQLRQVSEFKARVTEGFAEFSPEMLEKVGSADNALKSMLKDGVTHKMVVDELTELQLRDGIVLGKGDILEQAQAILSKDGAYKSLLSPERQEAVNFIQALNGDSALSFEGMVKSVTGIDMGGGVSALNSVRRSPSYSVNAEVASYAPKGKSFTTSEVFTKTEVDTIAKKSKGKAFDLGSKLEDGSYKYFEKTSDGYRLKIEELGEGSGIRKFRFTEEELGRLTVNEEKFYDSAQKINVSAGEEIFDVRRIADSGIFNKLENTLSKILC